MRSTRSDLAGVAWMLASGLALVGLNGIVRHLGPVLPAQQQAFLRFAFGLVLLGPALVAALRRRYPARTWRLFGLRGALHMAAVVASFYAMATIPLADVTAIGYLNPVIVTAGAAVLLGERLTRLRMAALAAALVGALIVLRPGLRTLAPGHAAQIFATVGFALSYLVAKRLAPLARPSEIVAMMTLVVTAGLAPLALAVWVPPAPEHLALLLAAAAAGSCGHYCMAQAFAAAPMTVTQPVTFLQLIWASILGVLAFGDPLDAWVLVGGAVMTGAVSIVTWLESGRSALRDGPV